MNFKKYIIRFILSILIIPATSIAQVNDAGLWMSLNVEKKITPLLSASVSQEFRMNENITELGTFFTDAGLTYKISKMFKVSANYRFTNKRQLDDSYSKRHRYYIDLAVRKKIKPVIFSFRTRFQSQYADVFSSETGKIPEYYSRNKLTVKFDLDKKYVPYVYSELFTPLSNNGGILMDNARFAAGIDYTINRKYAFDLFYMIQREYNVNDPQTDYIIGVGYNINF